MRKLLLLFVVLLVGCATTERAPTRTVEDILRGKTKAEILSCMGAAENTQAVEGKEVWEYNFGSDHHTMGIFGGLKCRTNFAFAEGKVEEMWLVGPRKKCVRFIERCLSSDEGQASPSETSSKSRQ